MSITISHTLIFTYEINTLIILSTFLNMKLVERAYNKRRMESHFSKRTSLTFDIITWHLYNLFVLKLIKRYLITRAY